MGTNNPAKDAPEGFKQRERVYNSEAEKQSITISSKTVCILKRAYQSMDEPDGIICFFNGDKMALLPADRDISNAYSVTSNRGDSGGTFSAVWLEDELERDTRPEGRFELTEDDGVWIADLSPENESGSDE
jgi:hypothetical protein